MANLLSAAKPPRVSDSPWNHQCSACCGQLAAFWPTWRTLRKPLYVPKGIYPSKRHVSAEQAPGYSRAGVPVNTSTGLLLWAPVQGPPPSCTLECPRISTLKSGTGTPTTRMPTPT